MNEEAEIRIMKQRKRIRIAVFVVIDILIVIASELMPLILRFGIFSINEKYLQMTLQWMIPDIIIAIAVIAFFKLYNRVWNFASVEELIDALKASVVIEVIYIVYKMLLGVHMPRSFYPFNWTILFMLLAGSRISVRILRRLRNRLNKVGEKRHIMIIGGGSAGSLLIKEIKNGTTNSRPVCIIDDNIAKKGKLIHGVPIIGDRNDIVSAAEKYKIDEIIIAIPSASPVEIREILQICQETGARVKRLPAIASTLTTSLSQSVREVNYEDLLGRDAVVIGNPELEAFVRGKTVMVTGGGGTIGSELCRQIAANRPGKLLIVDIYENTTYELEMELNRYYPDCNKEVLIASVRDYDRLDAIFSKYKPEVVYHAAAHKHVPLMEYSPNEAIKNNVFGTWKLAEAAVQYGTDRFVMISTDKAVNPTNIMGASKRICEMVVQMMDRRAQKMFDDGEIKVRTTFSAVRFGNVLGSNGSVLKIFEKQIANGGPVTVTDKNIIRYFMTIPEAVVLVMESGAYAQGGEIFVLNMGEPVKILDLAINLIRLSGYVPGEDIQIQFTGLRPGEKLYEEMPGSYRGNYTLTFCMSDCNHIWACYLF